MVDLEADTAAANDSEIDSDNAFTESDLERIKSNNFPGISKSGTLKKRRPTAADYLSSSSDEMNEGGAEVNEHSDDDEDPEESDEDDDMDDGLDALADGGESDDDEDDSAEDEDSSDGDGDSGDKEEKPIKNGPSLAATASASANADVQKGVAIQKQRKVYDGLLNLRIRLQKALVAVNTFPVIDIDSDEAPGPYTAAEEAAVRLLNTISDLKVDFGSSAHAGNKRKRGVDVSMPSDQIWEQLQADDLKAAKWRKANMEKWSQKVQAVNDASSKKSLSSSLEEQLQNTEYRLLKRTRVPRSCAPAQAAKRVAEDSRIYDDADFYQQLLKELVDQRTVDTSADHASTVPSVMLTAAKDAKSRKNVDRKASKGRKMRYTVHEKLQNFMAPEDRRSWEQGAIDRFFSTLFGQRMEFNEEESEEDEDMEGLSADAEGLRLFR